MPRMRRDPGYVSRMRMKVLDGERPRGRSEVGGLDPFAELQRPAGLRARQRARCGAHRHAEQVFGVHARHQSQGAFLAGLPLRVVGLRARRRGARSRGVAAGRQSGLGPQGDRRRDRHGRPQDHQPEAQGSGRVGLFHRLGDPGRRRSLPRRRLRPRRRSGEAAGRLADAGAERGALRRRIRRAVGGSRAAAPAGGASRCRTSTASSTSGPAPGRGDDRRHDGDCMPSTSASVAGQPPAS